MIRVTQSLRRVYPEAKFGVMAVKGIRSTTGRATMNSIVTAEIEHMKSKYPGYQRNSALTTEPLCHYAAYYKRYKKSYHVLGQLESVLLKGKSIPSAGIPIEAMFLAEIKNLLLTAGHDEALIEGALTVDVAVEPKNYVGLSEKELQLVTNDIYLSDEKGVLSSIINGPDYRTRITEVTQEALYFVYGVEGVTAPLIQAHLKTIFSYLSQAIQGVEMQTIEVA
jgi:DNA/RNA-binding domain of Phe-tRNA-synthetase-like protein